ncbi:MAG: GH36-type glycosyl hydrolase domain-containing protein, partial [Vicinamibacterales bacterium]
PDGLLFFNGLGGFTPDGREYVIRVDPASGRSNGWPPAPWSNVVSNARFGFCATDGNTGYTWSENSHDNRLTPWRNDPVADPPGEAVYIRDEDTGAFWSATPIPSPDNSPYLVRHGQGYTIYEHAAAGLASRLEVLVPPDDPVKLFRLRLRNDGPGPRRCSATLYVEWVLGDLPHRTAPHVVTFVDPATGALMARNPFRPDFGERVAYIDSDRLERTVTGDRTEFLGRNGALAAPAALGRHALGSRTGAALDPCGAIQVPIELAPGSETDVLFQLGEADNEEMARTLIAKYCREEEVQRAFASATELWNRRLATVQVETPDAALNLLLNRWLLYQTLSCRINGRSGFYQSSGAFGFRDQLQDVLALLFADPRCVREHILGAASRQFLEGDVQHWWHPPGGQGVRTRCSDDRLWLVFATLEYGDATGDWSILDDEAPFLEGRPLNPGEDEVYERPAVSSTRATLYEHCVRALTLSMEVGDHGLPLIGTGDWNDGMNMVGRGGRGESVWLGWFLAALLPRFTAIAESRRDERFAWRCRSFHARLVPALEEAWDGGWYRRAYFDDGTPLGSAANKECQIDSVAQSWAVIAGAGSPTRARAAMEAVDERLVSRDGRLIRLLAPPFDAMTPTPGYIQGYPPGIRENGGQYTHAALWVVLAWTRLGDGDRAAELYAMLNPVIQAATLEDVGRYRVEPYVVAGDVYSERPHAGRGGWTWYTGSSGWMYRVGVEAILGIELDHGALRINPCIPRAWKGYTAVVRTDGAEYRVSVENLDGVCRGVTQIEVDGRRHAVGPISLMADGRPHEVRVVLGRTGGEAEAEPAAVKQEGV